MVEGVSREGFIIVEMVAVGGQAGIKLQAACIRPVFDPVAVGISSKPLNMLTITMIMLIALIGIRWGDKRPMYTTPLAYNILCIGTVYQPWVLSMATSITQ